MYLFHWNNVINIYIIWNKYILWTLVCHYSNGINIFRWNIFQWNIFFPLEYIYSIRINMCTGLNENTYMYMYVYIYKYIYIYICM